MKLPPTLPRRLPLTAEGLTGTIAGYAARPVQALLMFLFSRHLRRALQRLADLYTLWQAGCLPTGGERQPMLTPRNTPPRAAAPQRQAATLPPAPHPRPRAPRAANPAPVAREAKAPAPNTHPESHPLAMPANRRRHVPTPAIATKPARPHPNPRPICYVFVTI
jgi:hypothetical protein